MATTYSPSLKLSLIGDGEQSGIWGQTTNNNLGTLLEQAITGVTSVVMADATYTLTNFNGVPDESRNAVLVVSGTNNGVRDVVPPLVEKLYTVVNNTTGGYAIRVIGATGTGVNIPNGTACLVYCDGINFYSGLSGAPGNFTASGTVFAVNVTATTNVTAVNVNATGNVAVTTNATVGGTFGVTGATTLTGTATAPTPTYPDNTTKIATTAFVNTAITTAQGIPSGSVFLLYQAAAPTGWTQVTALNDYALRLVSGTGGTTGGTTAFSTVFTNQTPTITTSGTTGATTLTIAQIPSHSHTTVSSGAVWGNPADPGPVQGIPTQGFYMPDGATNVTGNAGASNSHTHTLSASTSSTITLNVRYANIIICSKD
jgi:hypothetical protein